MTKEISSDHLENHGRAMTALSKVIDPELFINIVDLGLIYRLDFSSAESIGVTMTLSTPHCPMGEAITNGVRNALESEFPGYYIAIDVVFEPLWNFDMLTPEGRVLLGL